MQNEPSTRLPARDPSHSEPSVEQSRSLIEDVDRTGASTNRSLSSTITPYSSVDKSESPRSLRAQEWIPPRLKWLNAIAMALILLIVLIVVQILDSLNRRWGGFSADHQSLVLTTRYVPTVCVIVLSLAWKMLVSDLKKIIPWASLTKRWRAAEDSILLDYVDDLEILSLWKSCRRRHWGLFLAILGGLILGLSTVFSTSLFYVDPFFDYSKSASFSSTSRFEFNGSIASQPFNQSFANIVGQRRFGSKLPRWTTSEYAFESFGFPDALPNATWEAAVNGFTSWLDCSAIRYTPVPGCKSSMAHSDLSQGEIDDYCAPNPWSVDETSTPLHL